MGRSHCSSKKGLEGIHDVDGYLAIGWFYKSKNLKEAFSVVNEGIKHNPKAFQLHYLLSQLYLSQAKTETPNVQFPNEKATETLGKTRKSYQKAAEMGLKERGDGTAEAWSQAKELDVRGAARMTVLMGRRYGDHIESARLAKLYSDRLGGDETLDRFKSTQ